MDTIEGQKDIGGDDPLTKGLNKNTPADALKNRLDDIREILEKGEYNGKKISHQRRTFLTGFLKVAKRGFTKAFCPPFLEDLVMMVNRELCLIGDMSACYMFEIMGGEIVEEYIPNL